MDNNLISAVLPIPKIEPDSWDEWWKLWDENSNPIFKIKGNHNSPAGLNKWVGFDLYRTSNYNEDNDPYKSNYIDCADKFPIMFSMLKNIPINISHIRAISSTQQFTAHKDHNKPIISLRVMLFDNNPRDTFYYMLSNRKLKFQKFPENSNTWIYQDHLAEHGTHFILNHFKIILQIWGEWDFQKLKLLVESSDKNYSVFEVDTV